MQWFTKFFQEEPDTRVTVLVILSAAVLAFMMMIFGYFTTHRADFPEGLLYIENIQGQRVRVDYNPEKALVFVDEGAGTGDGNSGIIAEPATPLPPVITVTPIPPTPSTSMHTFSTHTVAAGDTLYNLAIRYNTTIELMARYGVSAADLYVGNVIDIYYANPAYCPGSTTYIIREGDTLSSIALKCGTTVDELKRLNNFGDVYSLNATDVVCVPIAPAPTPR